MSAVHDDVTVESGIFSLRHIDGHTRTGGRLAAPQPPPPFDA